MLRFEEKTVEVDAPNQHQYVLGHQNFLFLDFLSELKNVISGKIIWSSNISLERYDRDKGSTINTYGNNFIACHDLLDLENRVGELVGHSREHRLILPSHSNSYSTYTHTCINQQSNT